MNVQQNRFETLIEKGYDTAPGNMKQAVIDVADTAWACKVWFESYQVEATAADILTMTRLVMEREATLNSAKEP